METQLLRRYWKVLSEYWPYEMLPYESKVWRSGDQIRLSRLESISDLCITDILNKFLTVLEVKLELHALLRHSHTYA